MGVPLLGPLRPPSARWLLGLGALVGSAGAPRAQEILQAADVGGLEASSAALVLSGQEGGELPVSVLAVPFPGAPAGEGGGSTRLAVVIDVEGASLLAPAPEEAGEPEAGAEPAAELIVEVHAYAVAEGGALAGFFTQAFVLERAAVAGRAEWSGVKFLGALELPPGRFSLRLLVRERGSGRLALRAVPVTVPDLAGGEAVVLPPLFPAPPRWTLVRQGAPGGGPAGTVFPLLLDGRPTVPSTRPLLGAGETRFFVLGAGGEGAGPEGLTARLLAQGEGEGEPVELSPARGVEGAPVAAVETGLAAGPLEPGAYALVVTTAGGATATLPVVAPPPVLDPGRPPAWTDLVALSRAPPSPGEVPSGPAAPVPQVPSEESLGRLQAAYVEALERLAAGDPPAARAAVEALEDAALEGGTSDEALDRGQLQAAQDLAFGDAESLLPVIRLHEELYLGNLRGQRFRLAAHSRRVAQGLTELYAGGGGGAAARSLAADALVSLASHLIEAGNSQESVGLLERALIHDPRHPVALLTLAWLREQVADYDGAVDLLRRLLAVEPEQAEARLRLGVNLGRLGWARRARRFLGESCRAGEPEWVGVVACGELAALLAARGGGEEAVGVLEDAVARWPESQRLHIQLAAALDEEGRAVEAREVVETLDRLLRRGVGREADSPRRRYSLWPAEELEQTRRSFAAAAGARLPALASALAARTERGG